MASVTKRGKKWQARVEFTDSNGKRRTKSQTFTTKREAAIFANELEKKSFDGALTKDDEIPFPDFFRHWYELYKEPSISERTKLTYTRTQNVIDDKFKNVPIGEITRTSYQQFIKDFGQTHSKATINKINNHIRTCVKSAIYDDVIRKDFTDNVTIIYDPGKTRKIEYLNLDEMNTLADYLIHHLNYHFTSRHMILLAIYTGMRLGEIQALTWADVNFNFRAINIDKAWNETTQEFKDTKTEGSNRIIRINQPVIDMLRELKSCVQPETSSDMVFLNQFFTIPTSDAVNKTLRSVLKTKEISKKGFHFHSIRHTHVAYLLSKHVDLYLIAKRLGHKDMTTTIRTYSYLIDEYKVSGDDEIEAALNEIASSQKPVKPASEK